MVWRGVKLSWASYRVYNLCLIELYRWKRKINLFLTRLTECARDTVVTGIGPERPIVMAGVTGDRIYDFC